MLLSLYTAVGPVHEKPPLHKGWHKARDIINELPESFVFNFEGFVKDEKQQQRSCNVSVQFIMQGIQAQKIELLSIPKICIVNSQICANICAQFECGYLKCILLRIALQIFVFSVKRR